MYEPIECLLAMSESNSNERQRNVLSVQLIAVTDSNLYQSDAITVYQVLQSPAVCIH